MILVEATHVDAMRDAAQPAGGNSTVDPRRWWQWWQAQTQPRHYFAAGIEVWTQTGLTPIEGLLPGDRVLTRDLPSGELAFHLVLAVERQAEGPMLEIEVNSRMIVAEADQPFHVVDVGWRKAAELQAGTELDGLAGPVRISRTGPADAVAKYSLLVANASNYFVDPQGILAHDASPAPGQPARVAP
jgi:hypothetical protein